MSPQPATPVDPFEYTSVDDAALVARVRAGDPAAFDTIVVAHFARMVGYAAVLVGSRDDAEDVAQVVLERVWRLRATWQVTATIATYLLAAVRNEAANRHRTLRAEERRGTSLTRDAAVQAGAWGRDTADRLLDRADVEALVGRLTGRRREAIVLRYAMGLTYPEIGRVMGLSAKAAEQLVLRTIGTLRAWLAKGQ